MKRHFLTLALLLLLGLSQKPSQAQFAGCITPAEEPYAARFVLRQIYDLRFTVTVAGIGDFDPQLMIRDNRGRLWGCSQDDEDGARVALTLPSVQANFNERNAQMSIRFFKEENPDIDTLDFELIVTNKNQTTGQFVLIYEGEYLDDGLDVDEFSVLTTPEQVAQQIPLVMYVVNPNREEFTLNPQLRFGLGTALDQSCQNSALSEYCGPNTAPLGGFSITLGERNISLLDEHVMVNVIPNLPSYSYPVAISAVQQLSYGPYLWIVQSGVAYPTGFSGRG